MTILEQTIINNSLKLKAERYLENDNKLQPETTNDETPCLDPRPPPNLLPNDVFLRPGAQNLPMVQGVI